MTKEMLPRLTLGMVVLAIALFAAGCASGDPDEFETVQETVPVRDVAIIYSDRANSSGDLSVVEPYIKMAAENECYFVGVSSDGNPQSFAGTFELKEENGRRREAELQSNIEAIEKMNWTAQSAESNLFAAICKANDQLSVGGSPDVPNLLVIVDSGVSTTGPVNFTEEASRHALLDPEGFVAALRESGDLAKFENIDEVVWFGLGETSDPQGELNEGTRVAMRDLYRALFEAAGVSLSENDGEVFKAGSGVAPVGDLPGVTPVSMPRVSLDEDGNLVRLGDNVEFDETTNDGALTFAFDSSEFNNTDAAREALQDYINQLLDFPELQIVISGYTDTNGDENYNQELSRKRADAVKALFVDAGVSEGQITAVGMGESSDYADDAQNRRVEIAFGD